MNLYTYCGNNPVIYIDPSGHDWEGAKWIVLDEIYDGALWYQENAQYIPIVNYGNSIGQGIYEITYGDEYYFEHNEAGYAQWREELLNSTISTEALLITMGAAGLNGSESSWNDAVNNVKSQMSSCGSTIKNGWNSQFAKSSTYNSTQDAAIKLAKQFDGTVTQLKNGYKVSVSNGNKPIVIRVMNQGSGGRVNDYFRVSIGGKGSLTTEGLLSSDRGFTHIDLLTGIWKK